MTCTSLKTIPPALRFGFQVFVHSSIHLFPSSPLLSLTILLIVRFVSTLFLYAFMFSLLFSSPIIFIKIDVEIHKRSSCNRSIPTSGNNSGMDALHLAQFEAYRQAVKMERLSTEVCSDRDTHIYMNINEDLRHTPNTF